MFQFQEEMKTRHIRVKEIFNILLPGRIFTIPQYKFLSRVLKIKTDLENKSE